VEDVVDRFLRDAKVDIVPVDADLADRAMSGWRRYGKGRHPPGLNFGDCFAYALADRTGHPVLCTGNDFAATDITVVRPGTEQTGLDHLCGYHSLGGKVAFAGPAGTYAKLPQATGRRWVW